MNITATFRLPWRLVRAVGSRTGRLLRSARFWILFLLTFLVILIAYYALANHYTPYTTDAYLQAFVVQVAPRVEGQVVQVYVSENQRVEKGALLFEIDPRPFQHKVQQSEARLAQMVQQVAQLDSEWKAALAEEARVAADEDYALAVHEQEKLIFDKDATTKRKYLDAKQKHAAAQALLDKARAVVRQKREALEAKVGAEHALVVEARAQLATARLELEWTRVHAPAHGLVTNVQLRAGSFVLPGHPVLTCIDVDEWWVVANFRENNLERLRPGQPAAITFKSYPGRTFPGTVGTVGWGVGQGQGVPSGALPDIKSPQEWIPHAQRFQVRVVLDHPDEVPLRVGATGSVVIYTLDDFPLNPVADWLQRLESWVYYLR